LSALAYYLSLPFLYLVSLLPFRLLYALSDLVFFVLYYGFGYRKKVVLQNLRNSFPEKSEKEIIQISRSFYRYFCDLFLETFKTLTISRASMLRHAKMDEAALRLFRELEAANTSVVVVMGHKGNWEWAGNSFSLTCKHQLYVIYHPLSNKYFNGLIVRMRTRFGTKLIPMKDTLREMITNRKELNATAFIADQSPMPDKAYWMNFLNQDTPVFLGIEKIALKMKYPIVYVSVQKIKRGYYTMHAELLPVAEASEKAGEITELHTRRLEKDIISQPETWLWTHRRWKHART
jgi:Kdo2-lipid IVA lauroyltransferase/acyltransferase